MLKTLFALCAILSRRQIITYGPITGSPQFDLVYPTHPYWKQAAP